MKGKIVANWGAIDFKNLEHVRKFYGALQHFMGQPNDKKVRAALQHFTTKGDFPAEVLQVLERVHLTNNFDLGYEQVFNLRDFTGTKESGFEIMDVSSGLTFGKVLPGEKAKVYKISGTKASVSFDLYGGALGWNKTWFDDSKFWLAEDTAIEFRNKWFAEKAQNHYDLIDALGAGVNVAWQAVTPAGLPATDANYNAVRDMNTINYAALTILKALKNKGMGATVASQLLVLAPIDLMPRLDRALGLLNAGLAGPERGVKYNIRPIYTMMLAATDKYYVCFPKAKAQGGNRMDLTLMGETDILAYTETVAGWGRYGAAIGDTDQFKRCSIA